MRSFARQRALCAPPAPPRARLRLGARHAHAPTTWFRRVADEMVDNDAIANRRDLAHPADPGAHRRGRRYAIATMWSRGHEECWASAHAYASHRESAAPRDAPGPSGPSRSDPLRCVPCSRSPDTRRDVAVSRVPGRRAASSQRRSIRRPRGGRLARRGCEGRTNGRRAVLQKSMSAFERQLKSGVVE
jgi:hypothetical protein